MPGDASIREASPGHYRLEGAMTMATVTSLRSEGLRAFAPEPRQRHDVGRSLAQR